MTDWTADRVLALAPDSASVASGRELSSPAKWASAARSDFAVWGEAKGSGAKPYQTIIDLREPAFKCSCPSRKFPCKHALGLMLRAPSDTIMVLVSDLMEGGDNGKFLRRALTIKQSGVNLICLLALSDEGAPFYDHANAATLASYGIPTFACTPEAFPGLMAQAIKGAAIEPPTPDAAR